jgi:hypothetical protein
MGGRRVDGGEGFESTEQAIPFGGIASRVADFEVADARAAECSSVGEGFEDHSHFGVPESLQDAGVDQEGQRHASERSSRSASASTSSADETRCCRSAVAR